jgi:cyclic di-GMP phosphodiesterase Gmr
MFFVDEGDVDTFFHLTTGGESPYWSIAGDSDALCLGGSVQCSDIACKLNAIDLEKLRSLTGEPEEVSCSLSFYGQQFNVFLVGRRISGNKWQGIASARSLLETGNASLGDAGGKAYYSTR